MNKVLNILLLFSFTLNCIAQKEDFQWRVGRTGFIDFNKGVADTFSIEKINIRADVYCATNSSICGKNGNLLFYTNGKEVFNNKNDTLLNGDSISCPAPGYFKGGGGGLQISGACIILQRPNHPEQYYLFHQTFDNDSDMQVGYLSNILYLSVIDMTLDSGRGAVTKKNIHLWKNDTLMPGRLAAVRHGNGRDWWLISKKLYKPVFYKWLIASDSIWGPFVQSDEPNSVPADDGMGQACFSPLGNIYAILYPSRNLYVYNFDRCTGQLSKLFHSTIADGIGVGQGAGCAFSSSGRYLYANNRYNLFQYDLWSANIPGSKNRFATIDTSFICDGNKYMADFGQMRLAPDGKIYVGSSNGGCLSPAYMHLIEYPDSTAPACNFKQRGFIIASYGPTSVPNLPDYKLGRDFDSPCDTILTVQSTKHKVQSTMQVFPNPISSSGEILFKYTTLSGPARLSVFNVDGKEIFTYLLATGSNEMKLKLKEIAGGIYFARIIFENLEEIANAKFIVE